MEVADFVFDLMEPVRSVDVPSFEVSFFSLFNVHQSKGGEDSEDANS